MDVERKVVHCIEIGDRPGSLQKLLATAAEANVDLDCFMAFSAGGGKGKVYLNAKEPETLEAFARDAGIEAKEFAGFVIGGEDKAGAAAEALKGLADAKINGLAGSAVVCNGHYHMGIVVAAVDADAAEEALAG